MARTGQAHVLFITRWYPHRDDPQLGSFIRKHALAATNHFKVSVLSIRASDQDELISRQHENKLLEVTVTYKRSSLGLVNTARYFSAFMKGYSKIKKELGKPQLVNLNILPTPFLPGVFLKITQSIPYIITEHWSGYMDGRFNKLPFLYKLIYHKAVRMARKVIVVSQPLLQGMKDAGLQGDFVVVPNVISSTTVTASTSDGSSLCMVADLVDEVKGISGVIRAVINLNRQGKNVVLSIAGEGPDRKELEALVQKGKASSFIYFHGRILPEEVPAFVARHSALIVNSRHESFSMVTAEAFSVGVPVISSKCGGPEHLINADTGILFKTGDQPALENAITTLLAAPEKFNRQAMKEVSLQFTAEKVGSLLAETFNDVIATK